MDQQLTLTVTGMTCGGCENTIKRALSMIDGVYGVTARHGDNVVTLRYDSAKVTPAAIASHIQMMGYDVPPDGLSRHP